MWKAVEYTAELMMIASFIGGLWMLVIHAIRKGDDLMAIASIGADLKKIVEKFNPPDGSLGFDALLRAVETRLEDIEKRLLDRETIEGIRHIAQNFPRIEMRIADLERRMQAVEEIAGDVKALRRVNDDQLTSLREVEKAVANGK